MAFEIEPLIAAENQLGEGPVWNAEDQSLYWVDIEQNKILRFRPEFGSHQVFDLGQSVTSLGVRASGGLVVSLRDGFAFFDLATEIVQRIENSPSIQPGSRFNDGAVDPQGRFWAGTMSNKLENGLFRLDLDRSVKLMDSGFGISNGLGWSPDSKTMYFTDSIQRVIYAYDFDPANGDIENRRDFIRVPEGEGVPDGLTVDSEGFIWSARWDGWKIVRYDPMGKVALEIHMPVQRPTSCTFGGEDLTALYVTSARVGLDESALKGQPLAGDIFRIHTHIKGLKESLYFGKSLS